MRSGRRRPTATPGPQLYARRNERSADGAVAGTELARDARDTMPFGVELDGSLALLVGEWPATEGDSVAFEEVAEASFGDAVFGLQFG